MSHYQHFTTSERESIRLKIGEGKSIRTIATELKRSPSTISRELSRNLARKRQYSPDAASQRYRRCRKRCHKRTVFSNQKVKEIVQRLFLEEQWSPGQIANRTNIMKYHSYR